MHRAGRFSGMAWVKWPISFSTSLPATSRRLSVPRVPWSNLQRFEAAGRPRSLMPSSSKPNASTTFLLSSTSCSGKPTAAIALAA
eukprot:8673985-Pyramimonas_sp.AAC.1